MVGATPYLRSQFPLLSPNEARDIVLHWMQNYNALHRRLVREPGAREEAARVIQDRVRAMLQRRRPQRRDGAARVIQNQARHMLYRPGGLRYRQGEASFNEGVRQQQEEEASEAARILMSMRSRR